MIDSRRTWTWPPTSPSWSPGYPGLWAASGETQLALLYLLWHQMEEEAAAQDRALHLNNMIKSNVHHALVKKQHQMQMESIHEMNTEMNPSSDFFIIKITTAKSFLSTQNFCFTISTGTNPSIWTFRNMDFGLLLSHVYSLSLIIRGWVAQPAI